MPGPRDAALPNIPRRKEINPGNTESCRILLVPPASRKNSHLLSLPDGMGQCPAQTLQITQSLPSVWWLSFLERKEFKKKIYKVAHCTFKKPCRSSVLYTSNTSMVPALALLTTGVKGQLKRGKRVEKCHTNPGEFLFSCLSNPLPDPTGYRDVSSYGE